MELMYDSNKTKRPKGLLLAVLPLMLSNMKDPTEITHLSESEVSSSEDESKSDMEEDEKEEEKSSPLKRKLDP